MVVPAPRKVYNLFDDETYPKLAPVLIPAGARLRRSCCQKPDLPVSLTVSEVVVTFEVVPVLKSAVVVAVTVEGETPEYI